MSENWLKQSVAEAIGTFALIFVGVLSISAAGIVGAPAGLATLASIGLAHGLTIAVMVAALGAISGGHFNPAVTFGFVVTGRMKAATGAIYWIAQLVGASAAGLLIAALFGAGPVVGGTPDLGRGVGVGPGIVIEAVATFFLVLVVFGTAVEVPEQLIDTLRAKAAACALNDGLIEFQFPSREAVNEAVDLLRAERCQIEGIARTTSTLEDVFMKTVQ